MGTDPSDLGSVPKDMPGMLPVGMGREKAGYEATTTQGYGDRPHDLMAAMVLSLTPSADLSSSRSGGNSNSLARHTPGFLLFDGKSFDMSNRRSSARRSAFGSPGVTARTIRPSFLSPWAHPPPAPRASARARKASDDPVRDGMHTLGTDPEGVEEEPPGTDPGGVKQDANSLSASFI